ncbi:MAG: PAS domain S-box protein [Deltaproteobacteria bacterium]|nr:PAS domain S-box protein [Deltaproteobacteria bacterium]
MKTEVTPLSAPAVPLPSQAEALLSLGREVAGATSEEALVQVVARALRGLLPGRAFAVRVTDPRSFALTSLYAEGPLKDPATGPLVIKRSAVQRTGLRLDEQAAGRVEVVDGPVPLLFEGTARGLSAPLVASGQLFGLLNVEVGPEGPADLEADARVLIQVANLVAVGMRTAKLIDELKFVRGSLEELLEHANALICATRLDGTVLIFNGALCRLTGLHREQVLGRPLSALVPDEERAAFEAVMAEAVAGRPLSNVETRLRAAGGREVRVAFSFSALPNGEQADGVIAIGQDLTALRALERAVVHSERLASLGQLAASVVHEINNPLTAIHTYADALLARRVGQPDADAGEQEKLRRILDNTDRVLRFAQDLVTYARPPSDTRTDRVDVHRLLDLSVSFSEHVLHKHGVTVERDYQPVPPVQGSRSNLVQVFVNLLTNACHALQPGGRVRLSVEPEGQGVLIRVADTGCGIPADVLPRIFEPFFTTKAEGMGTGLGLSIAHSIVQRHGGSLRVESSPGEGTTFSIRLLA